MRSNATPSCRRRRRCRRRCLCAFFAQSSKVETSFSLALCHRSTSNVFHHLLLARIDVARETRKRARALTARGHSRRVRSVSVAASTPNPPPPSSCCRCCCCCGCCGRGIRFGARCHRMGITGIWEGSEGMERDDTLLSIALATSISTSSLSSCMSLSSKTSSRRLARRTPCSCTCERACVCVCALAWSP